MSDSETVAQRLETALKDVDELRPADELAAYEQVLAELTELLNAPDEQGPGLS